ncbi:hypothetical protein CA165_22385 [Vibrio parahaemolyticus]|nr:hypothetical protein CA165_22385 [Vibrio parahaemolyticus]
MLYDKSFLYEVRLEMLHFTHYQNENHELKQVAQGLKPELPSQNEITVPESSLVHFSLIDGQGSHPLDTGYTIPDLFFERTAALDLSNIKTGV